MQALLGNARNAASAQTESSLPHRLRLSLNWRHVRWTLRRWNWRHLWYRARLPLRRRRWTNDNEKIATPFAKRIGLQRTTGPAIVFGDFAGSNGLGRGAAYDVTVLKSYHDSIRMIDIAPLLHDGKIRQPRIEVAAENVYFFCQPDTYGQILRYLDPADLRNCYRVGRWVWETPEFPQSWRFAERLVHEVWAPSEFCASVFRRATSLPVTVVPHAVSVPEPARIDFRNSLGISQDVFLGVAIMDISSCPERKNPWGHVEAWKAAFGNDPNAVLVMKLRVGKRTRIVLKELRELIGEGSNIKLLTDELSGHEVAALHQAADVYLSLHRSEGFGLNIYEALLLNKFVVATHWSANAEYGPKFERYMGVPFTMTAYRDWLMHYPGPAFEWADPDIRAAAEALKEVRRRRHPTAIFSL